MEHADLFRSFRHITCRPFFIYLVPQTSGTYVVVQEVVELDGKLVANAFDITIDNSTGKITINDECPSEFEFEADNKVPPFSLL